MENTMTVKLTTDVVACARPAASVAVLNAVVGDNPQHMVRVTAPFAAQGVGDKSAVGTDDITLSRSGHVSWSPPV